MQIFLPIHVTRITQELKSRVLQASVVNQAVRQNEVLHNTTTYHLGANQLNVHGRSILATIVNQTNAFILTVL